MRILVYLLSLLMVFAPTYSAYASGITKGQIIQMGKKGGALVRTGAGVAVKVGKVSRALTPVGAIVWCASNKKCKDYAGDAFEIACDISGVCTAERKDDDKEYPQFQFRLSTGQIFDTPDEMCNFYMHKQFPNASEKTYHNHYEYIVGGSDYELGDKVGCKMTIKWVSAVNTRTEKVGHDPKIVYMGRVIPSSNKHGKLTEDELKQLAKKIAEQMDDDDIKNYYNTDYDDITINNYHYYGDDIDRETNIDKYCDSNACNEISKEIEQDINDKKYDIDDVTPANCTIEENTGKYIACSITINNEEENTQTPPKDDTDIPKKEDDDPLSCDTSKFHKKICDWMDWTQDDLEVPDESKPKIKDLSDDLQIDKNRVNFGRACPVGDNLALSLHGVSISHQISYQGLCDAFTTMRPFIIGIGGIISVMIIGGRRV